MDSAHNRLAGAVVSIGGEGVRAAIVSARLEQNISPLEA